MVNFALINILVLTFLLSFVESLGVLLWEISSCRLPFSDKINYMAVLVMIMQGCRENPVEGTSPEYVRLYQECWKTEPELRPKISSVMERLENIDVVQIAVEVTWEYIPWSHLDGY